MKHFHLFIALLFFLSLLSVSASPFAQTQSSLQQSVSSFLKRTLDINVNAMQRFVIKPPDKHGRFRIEIENANKKIRAVFSKTQDSVDELKLMFMEQVTRFGNEKSFLNIRTSRGSRQEDANSEGRIEKAEKSSDFQISTPTSTSEINKFQDAYGGQLQKFISESFPMANLKNTKLLDSSEPDVYKLQIEIGRIWYLLTILKEINKSNELKIGDVTKLSDK